MHKWNKHAEYRYVYNYMSVAVCSGRCTPDHKVAYCTFIHIARGSRAGATEENPCDRITGNRSEQGGPRLPTAARLHCRRSSPGACCNHMITAVRMTVCCIIHRTHTNYMSLCVTCNSWVCTTATRVLTTCYMCTGTGEATRCGEPEEESGGSCPIAS